MLYFNIVVTGSTNSGKTNMISRFVENKFTENTPSTIGLEYVVKTILWCGETIQLRFLDVAGKEQYRPVLRCVYSFPKGIFFVYDITNKQSFDFIKDEFNVAKTLMNELPVMFLIGNKSDLEKQREVDDKTASEFASQNSMIFFETSAMNDINIYAIFNLMIQRIVKLNKPSNEPIYQRHVENPLSTKLNFLFR